MKQNIVIKHITKQANLYTLHKNKPSGGGQSSAEKENSMNIIKTNFKVEVNKNSSFIVYITKTYEEAKKIHNIHLENKSILPDGWYYGIQTVRVEKDCRVPKFFHGNDYYATIIEHNKGDWNKSHPTYELYIVEGDTE